MNERRLQEKGTTEDSVYIPLTDIYETEDVYSLKIEMPGVKKDNLDIVIDEKELRITAKTDKTEEADKIRYSEYSDRDFYRVFKIGYDIDRSRVDANLENGVLTLKLHKSEDVKPKKIAINQIN
jgi:HSP20 family protein